MKDFVREYKELSRQEEEAWEEWEGPTPADDELPDDHTLAKLLVGMTFYMLIIAILIFLVIRPGIYYKRGYIIGVMLAYFMILAMDFFNNYAIEGPIESMRKRLVLGYVVRLTVLIIVMVLGLVSGYADVILMLLGIMTIKLSVYSKPILDKLFEKISRRHHH